MILSCENLPSGVTVEVRIYDVTDVANLVLVTDWTAVGVVEIANGEGLSAYLYNASFTPGNSYLIDWRDNSTPVNTVSYMRESWQTQIEDLHDEAFGKWTLDPAAKTLTLYRADGVTVLKTFNLTDTSASINPYIQREPA